MLMKEGYSRKLSKLEKAFFEAVDAYFEAKKDMEAEIAPIVDMLEEKGYRVKYASPGHSKLRKKEDEYNKQMIYELERQYSISEKQNKSVEMITILNEDKFNSFN